MKQFNLKEYLANPTRKVITRDGKPVRILCTDAKGDYPVIGLIEYEDAEMANSFKQDGSYWDGSECLERDLFFAPEKKEGFINIYYHNKKYVTEEIIHNTEEDAKRFIIHNMCYITTIKLAWEE